MKKQSTIKFVLILILVILITILGIAILLQKEKEQDNLIDESNGGPNYIDTLAEYSPLRQELLKKTTEEEYWNCIETLSENIDGNWSFPGSEVPTKPNLQLFTDGTFEMTDGYDDAVLNNGSWKYNEKELSITLKFQELDNYWSSVLKNENLKLMYESVADYSFEDAFIELYIGYSADLPEGFKGKCYADNFMINLFNLYLYSE